MCKAEYSFGGREFVSFAAAQMHECMAIAVPSVMCDVFIILVFDPAHGSVFGS